jgi:hypothetical protein
MQKKKILLTALVLSVGISLLAFYSFKKPAKDLSKAGVKKESPDQINCPTSFSCVLFDGCHLLTNPCQYSNIPECGCLPADNCSGDWKIPNFNWSVSGTTVNFSGLAVCYKWSATPPWTSFSKIGYLRLASIKPSGTRVVSATASNGATFQCTIYSNGDWYIQKTSGTDPGRGTSLSGSYSL